MLGHVIGDFEFWNSVYKYLINLIGSLDIDLIEAVLVQEVVVISVNVEYLLILLIHFDFYKQCESS